MTLLSTWRLTGADRLTRYRAECIPTCSEYRMTEQQTVTPADNLAELKHLLGLVDIEMQILGSSTGHMAHWLGRMPLKFARETLPWKRGKTVVEDVSKLSQHLARVAELLPLVESEQEATAAQPEGKQADSATQL